MNEFDDILGEIGVNNTNQSTESISSQPNSNQDYTDNELSGLSIEEKKDPNSIIVTIPDKSTPIVLFFGTPSSGKTLALLRMIRFLETNGYTVIPEYVFRPSTDKHYKRMCDNLKNMVYSPYTPGGTDIISFMLVKVMDQNGKPVCQILEAPGEHYFNDKQPNSNADFPTYINAIISSPNRKTWVFFTEQDWGASQHIRDLYSQKIFKMQGLITRDKVVFLFNKADKFPHQFGRNGRPDSKLFFTTISQQYPNIFSKYKNTGLASLLYGSYNFQTVCFSSGLFNKINEDQEAWNPSDDWYCRGFWNAIK